MAKSVRFLTLFWHFFRFSKNANRHYKLGVNSHKSKTRILKLFFSPTVCEASKFVPQRKLRVEVLKIMLHQTQETKISIKRRYRLEGSVNLLLLGPSPSLQGFGYGPLAATRARFLLEAKLLTSRYEQKSFNRKGVKYLPQKCYKKEQFMREK